MTSSSSPTPQERIREVIDRACALGTLSGAALESWLLLAYEAGKQVPSERGPSYDHSVYTGTSYKTGPRTPQASVEDMPSDKQETPRTDYCIANLFVNGKDEHHALETLARQLERELDKSVEDGARLVEDIDGYKRDIAKAHRHIQSMEKVIERAEKAEAAPSATLPSLAQLSDAIQYAVNYHSIDAKANIADYEIAHRIAPQVLERLQSYVEDKR